MVDIPEKLWAWWMKPDAEYDHPGGPRWKLSEPDGEDVDGKAFFLRADTCTPNEECVSKAELEKAVNVAYPTQENLEIAIAEDDTLLAAKIAFALETKQRILEELELREVMDK